MKMARAFKCDRCGELYEKAKSNKQLVIKSLFEAPYSQTNDICPKCWADFEKWMGKEQEKAK